MNRIAVMIVVALMAGCAQAPRTKVVVTEAWKLPTEGKSIEILDDDKRLALKVSGDGRIWEWDANPEKVASILIAQIVAMQGQFQAYEQQVATAAAAKVKSAAAVKKTEKPKEGK